MSIDLLQEKIRKFKKQVDKRKNLFYNPKYKSEVMNWGVEISVDAVVAANSGCHGCYIGQNQ